MLSRISGWIASWRRMLHEGLNDDGWDGLSKFRDAEAIWLLVAGTPILVCVWLPELGIAGAWLDWLLGASIAWGAIVIAYGLFALIVSAKTYFGNYKNRD